MERPNKLSGEQLKYVEYLEEKIEKFSLSTTITRSYFALKKTVDGLNDLMFNGIELPELNKDGEPTGKIKRYELLSPHSLTSKDDKIFDRIFKFMEKQPSFLDSMEKLSEKISPEDRDKEDYASEYEEVQDSIK
jgi:hypothetical protein